MGSICAFETAFGAGDVGGRRTMGAARNKGVSYGLDKETAKAKKIKKNKKLMRKKIHVDSSVTMYLSE